MTKYLDKCLNRSLKEKFANEIKIYNESYLHCQNWIEIIVKDLMERKHGLFCYFLSHFFTCYFHPFTLGEPANEFIAHHPSRSAW